MKYTFFFFLLIASTAQASHYWCSRSISAERTEFANVMTFPSLVVGTSFKECVGTDPCRLGVLEQIVSAYNVCFHPSMQACKIAETAMEIAVDCPTGIGLRFDLDQTMHGTITCFQNGSVTKTWDAGQCVKKL